MSLFKNLTSEGHEETQDRLGGGYRALDTDLYAGKIKLAYAGTSQGGAMNVTVVMAFPGQSEYRETVYVTDKTGKNYSVDKTDAKKKNPLPGFTTIDDLCQVTCDGKTLSEMTTEDKVVNIYDYDQKKEVPKTVPVLVELLDQDVLVAIQKVLENKSVKVGDKYEPTADTREVNNIVKVFHPEYRVTVGEAKRGKQAGEFIDQWVEKNKGQTYDKRTIKDGDAGQSGRPGKPGANAGPPQAGAGSTRKSLFGAKS